MVPAFFVCFLSYYRRHDSPGPSVISELTEVNALPGAEVQSPVSDRNVDANTRDDALCVCWHIVGAFKNVAVVRHILRNEPVENRLHVSSYVWVPVLAIAFFRRDSAKLKQAWLCSRCSVSSHILNAQLVCCINRLSSPVFGNWGRCRRTSSVTRWKPRDWDRSVNSNCCTIRICSFHIVFMENKSTKYYLNDQEASIFLRKMNYLCRYL